MSGKSIFLQMQDFSASSAMGMVQARVETESPAFLMRVLLVKPLSAGEGCMLPGLPCPVFFDSQLSCLVPGCHSFSLLQPTSLPMRLFCSPGSSVQIFFFFTPLKAPTTLAGFSSSVSNNSAFLNTVPPLRLSVLFLSLCVLFPSLPCSCCCSFFSFFFSPASAWICLTPC